MAGIHPAMTSKQQIWRQVILQPSLYPDRHEAAGVALQAIAGFAMRSSTNAWPVSEILSISDVIPRPSSPAGRRKASGHDWKRLVIVDA
jgi:hypothetical protein